MSDLSFVAGLLLVLKGAFNIFAHYIGRKRGIALREVSLSENVRTPITNQTASWVGLPKLSLVTSWGIILMACSEEVATTRLGAAICSSIAAYLALEFFALRIPEVGGSPLVVRGVFSALPAACLVIIATSWFVT
jgi:hypothetical protein